MKMRWWCAVALIYTALPDSNSFSQSEKNRLIDLSRKSVFDSNDKTCFVNSRDHGELKHNLLLYSLNWSSSTSAVQSLTYSKVVNDVWKWKDSVLGNGRDFFIPRTRTLKALQSYILKSCEGENPWCTHIEECVILSNCARFDIILVVDDDPDVVKQHLSACLLAQINAFESRPMNRFHLDIDWPGYISPDCPIDLEAKELEISELSNYWNHLSGVESISRYLFLVAAGMATRPNRPDRAVTFRPFSSRDAHILLQLKRTYDCSARKNPRVAMILKYALRVGKAIRNPSIVPELDLLKKYGTGDTKYDSSPSEQLLASVTKIAYDKVIEPFTGDCVSASLAWGAGESIQKFRHRCLLLATDELESKVIRQKLHEPTMLMRKGEWFDQKRFLEELFETLHQARKLSASQEAKGEATAIEKIISTI